MLSRKEQKAKKIVFDRRRTLIHGKNDTGKSSLIKSIYKTFGAEPLMHPGFVAANVSSLVRFELDDVQYQVLRDGKYFALFDADDRLIKKFSSVTKDLAIFFSDLFDFKPLFHSKNLGFIIPPPAFLFLPYYVDQDKSWTESWAAFKHLQQIRDHKSQSIYYHSGLRPNAYYATKKEIEEFVRAIEEIGKEQSVAGKILKDIKSKLAQTEFNIDVDTFKAEITELLIEMESLKDKENSLKSDLHDLYHLKAAYDAQINIVKQAIIESSNDLKFASEILPETISCPTCGAEYQNSFGERFEIARDELKSKDLLFQLVEEAKEVDDNIALQNSQLTRTIGEVIKIDNILQEKKGDVSLRDVIASEGKNQVRAIFQSRYQELNESIMKNALEKKRLDGKLKSFESKERRKEIMDYYTTTFSRFLKELEVFTVDMENYKNITTRVEMKETGSSRPRALIAYYFTFFHLMHRFSSTTYCPLIVDSPNQQDQDIEHIDKIMEFINKNQPQNSQLILGLAETYGVDFNCKVVELTTKYELLQKNEYELVHNELGNKLETLWFN